MDAGPTVKAARRLRVLLIAEAANPRLTSVALIGWSFSRAMAEAADAHLVSEQRNAADIAAADLGGMQFTPINNRRWQGLAWNVGKALRGGTALGWTTYSALGTLAYPFFEAKVWRAFRDRLRAGEFDLVHRVTPLAPVVPSLLAGHCARAGVPFVIGPLNGGVPWPKEFSGLRRAEKEWLSYVRGAYKLLPGVHATRRHAAAILIAARTVWREMPERFRPKCVYLPENAIDVARFPRQEPPSPRSPVGVAFVGRFVPLKGVDMLLEAAAPLVRAGRLTLDLIGDGPELPRLRQLADDLKIAGGTAFPGWVDHSQMAGRLGRSHIFGFPSVREFGGGVVLEAMARGLVPVVLDYGGPGELVPPNAGCALPMAPRAALIPSLRECLTRLAADPDRLRAMAVNAQDHVYRNFTWPAKVQQVQAVYRWVLGRGPKPDFGMPLR
jgi:glycosyltransferase involved in cell wall biosynthesis